MLKLLVISNDIDRDNSSTNPHALRPHHETAIREAAGSSLQVVIAAPSQASAHYAEAEIVAAFPMRIPSLAELPEAKWLHSFSAGVDKILTPEVRASPIHLTNSSGVHATPIAEHIVGFMLLFTRQFPQALRDQRAHEWRKERALGEVKGARVLIVGMGEIGTETARLLHAFGAHVSALSRSAKQKPEFVEHLASSDKLDELLPEADVVVITLPHTSETHHLFDAKKFALMKRSAVLINIGRGQIVNEPDLVAALQTGTIAGAGLDVFETEPLPKESALWDMEQVIITPHNSGLSHQYMNRAVELFCKNIRAYLMHEPLPNEVDKQLGY
jgi:phosphoglycerate dehydrogenase-like enzyme